MEYKIIERNSIKAMEAAVELKLLEGWRPQGGVSLAAVFNDEYEETIYTQAIVKDKSKRPPPTAHLCEKITGRPPVDNKD